MFVRCPHCHALVAADATGTAPEHCPYCDGLIAIADAKIVSVDVEADEAVENVSAPVKADEVQAAVTTGTEAPPRTAYPVEPESGEEANDAMAADSSTDEIGADGRNTDEVGGNDITDSTGADKASSKPARRKRKAPSFVRRQTYAADRPTPRWLWGVAAGLGLVAAMQILLADRAHLATDARWRLAIVSICNVLHCAIPAWREPAAFDMLSRDVRQHPSVPGALQVAAAFRNNARWPQPWPDVVLTLSDVNGRVVGMRTFLPREYLGGKVTQKEIGAGQSAAIRMQVMEPAAGVVSFSFDFR